ncbi:hypothetical protein [Anaerococcus sp. Marseille-P3625]|uniref:hypothetical protein n=1 Tax=Anaerococcus sp. Marseille-P3625 TaxID=1977277 RepID=UPI000C06F78F|nr:hypothetical protein [Anaerococcus sp. Marseille-P3625]
MAVEKMYLVNMVSKLKNLDEFLEDVIQIGDIEPVDAFNQVTNRNFNIKASAENVDITEDINELSGFEKEDSDDFIEKLKELKESLNLKDSSSKRLVDRNKINELYEKLKSLLKEKEELEEKSKILDVYSENVQLLKEYKIDIEKVKNLKHFDYRYGSVSEDGRFILKNNYENIPSLIIHLDGRIDNANLRALDDIYSLDQTTDTLEVQTQKILNDEIINTRNVSLRLDQDYNSKNKDLSDKIYKEILDAADVKIEKINLDYQSKIDFMDEIYEKYKGEVVEDVVTSIIDDKDLKL